MPRVERGVYEPSDEVRVFDGGEDEEDSEGSRLPLLIVLALVVLCAFAGVVWLAYVNGVAKGRSETPVLAAAAGPERVAPQNPGGAAVPYQGFKIYEQPAPPDDQADAAAPAKAEAPPAAKIEAPPPAAAKLQPAPAPAPPVKVAAAAPPPKPAPVAAAPKPLPTPPPAMKPATAPPVSAGVATGAPRTLPGVAAAKPAPTKPAAASGAYTLQIGAYKSQADADAAWKAYKAKHAALLAGYGPDVQKADLGDKGTWYRLRVAGFADHDVAAALCDRLKADGGGGCIVGK